MDNKEITTLTNKLLNEGYELNCINQIIKGYEKGYLQFKNIKSYVTAQDIRKLSDGYNTFYLNSEPNKNAELELIKEQLIDVLNNKLPIDKFIDKRHSISFITIAMEELMAKHDISILENPDTTKDYSKNELVFFKYIRDHKDFNLLTTKDIDDLKKNIEVYTSDELEELKDQIEYNGIGVIKYLSKIKPSNLSILPQLIKAESICPELIDNLVSYNREITEFLIKNYLLDKEKVYKIIPYIESNEVESLNSVQKLLYGFENDKIDEILKMDMSMNNKLEVLDLIKKGADLDLIKGIFSYDYRGLKIGNYHCQNTIIDASKVGPALYPFIFKEMENNINVDIYDIKEIVDGYKEGIDVSLYISKDDLSFDSEEKEFIKEILKYNKLFPNNPIDLSIIDKNYYEISYNGDNLPVEDLMYAIKKGININNLVYFNGYEIEEIMELEDEDIITNEILEKLAEYKQKGLIKEDKPIAPLVYLIKDGYEIVNKTDIMKKSIPLFKELKEISKYDDFCEKIIDNIEEDNIIPLYNMIKNYIQAPSYIQNLYQLLYNKNIFPKNKIDINISKEKINILCKDIEDGINPLPYMNNIFTLPQIEGFSKINHTLLKKEIDPFYIDPIKKSLYKNFNKTQLDYINKQIEDGNYKIHSVMNIQYSPEQMQLYQKWEDKYIYNFVFYQKYEEIDNKICKNLRKEFAKLDKSLPIEEQKLRLNEIEKNVLTKVAEEATDMDLKIAVFNLLTPLEQSKNIPNQEIIK